LTRAPGFAYEQPQLPGRLPGNAFSAELQELKDRAMARRCIITGKDPLVGHNVSHSKRRTKRRFLPNLQVTSLWSDSLNLPVKLRISTAGLRTVEHNGGIDAFLIDTPDAKLSAEAKRLKRRVERAKEKRAAA
jgi:large subunit ribosomal protein L28